VITAWGRPAGGVARMCDVLFMPSHLPRLLAATALAVTVLTVATGCSAESPETAAAPPAAAVPGSSAQIGDGPAPSAAVTRVATTAPEKVVLADGRHPGFIDAVGGGAVTMDLVEFLTGDAAAKAWQKKYPDSGQDSPDNDYFIVNDNPKLRKLPVAPSVVVKVVGDTGPEATRTIAVTGMTKHFGDQLDDTLFWFTVQKGTVTKIEQQFLP
jgi:hypothetical protein